MQANLTRCKKLKYFISEGFFLVKWGSAVINIYTDTRKKGDVGWAKNRCLWSCPWLTSTHLCMCVHRYTLCSHTYNFKIISDEIQLSSGTHMCILPFPNGRWTHIQMRHLELVSCGHCSTDLWVVYSSSEMIQKSDLDQIRMQLLMIWQLRF